MVVAEPEIVGGGEVELGDEGDAEAGEALAFSAFISAGVQAPSTAISGWESYLMPSPRLKMTWLTPASTIWPTRSSHSLSSQRR